MSHNVDLSTWSDDRLAENSEDEESLGVAKLRERRRRRQGRKEQRKREEAARLAAEELRKQRKREAGAEATKRRSVAVVLPSTLGGRLPCLRCAERGLSCIPGSGESAPCAACKKVKKGCNRPKMRAELGSSSVRARKRVRVESEVSEVSEVSQEEAEELSVESLVAQIKGPIIELGKAVRSQNALLGQLLALVADLGATKRPEVDEPAEEHPEANATVDPLPTHCHATYDETVVSYLRPA
ncbi:uncharacterized protein EI90DRAFT_1828825 [Cantharellus anzutake]|uniref:uncharacterized protein n=1 Tax=Cantharellus anzutake TaxID=1750568 RepID=UPI001908CCD3|nr:uncharacterized protein EI90DRAFT_1828825 [Cantharellus anzutake]KAF8327207.1 hypothetical protein EI90DRAFT_1828825 [Cantharellus anzutake]